MFTYVLLSAVLATGVIMEASGAEGGDVRTPAVQGQFYPGDKNALARQVDEFLTREPATVVTGRIRQCRMSRLAAAKRRDDAARDRDSDAYQSAIFRVEVVVEFQTVKPGREKPLIAARQARGVADFSHLPDMNAAKQEALRLAVNDVASEMVAAVAEAW